MDTHPGWDLHVCRHSLLRFPIIAVCAPLSIPDPLPAPPSPYLSCPGDRQEQTPNIWRATLVRSVGSFAVAPMGGTILHRWKLKCKQTGFWTLLHSLGAVCPWISCLASLSFSFLFCRMRMLILLLDKCLQGLNEIIIARWLTQWLGFSCSLLLLMISCYGETNFSVRKRFPTVGSSQYKETALVDGEVLFTKGMQVEAWQSFVGIQKLIGDRKGLPGSPLRSLPALKGSDWCISYTISRAIWFWFSDFTRSTLNQQCLSLSHMREKEEKPYKILAKTVSV